MSCITRFCDAEAENTKLFRACSEQRIYNDRDNDRDAVKRGFGALHLARLPISNMNSADGRPIHVENGR